MPKKPPRNSFYFFMVDYKEEQRKKGINYANMAQVAEAAGPAWKDAPPPVRARYEAIAKAEKAKMNVPECKFTSQGVPLSEIAAAERERVAAIEAERKYIMNFVKQKSVDNSILDEDMFIVDVNAYCKVDSSYLIGEFTLLRFSLRDGIKDGIYHELVNPGRAPLGYALDVREGCRALGLPPPDPDTRRTDFIKVLANVLDVMRVRGRALPPLYTLPEKVAPVADFIQQLCSRAAEDSSLLQVYRLDWLLHALARDALPKESLALARLREDRLKYTRGLGCQMHEAGEVPIECSMARARRWAYTVLDTTCELLGLPPAPARHMPPGGHLDSIQQYKERGGRAWAPDSSADLSHDTSHDLSHDAADTPAQSDNTTYSSLNDSSASTVKKRVHVPLRMPKIDYAAQARAAPALTDEEEFPALGGARGRGRGRTLAANFGKMQI